MRISRMVKAEQVRTAMAPSMLYRLLEAQKASLENQILTKLKAYVGAEAKNPQVKLEFANGYMNVSLWIPGQESKDEAQEMADILLGSGVQIGEHAMVKGMWVATQKVDLRHLMR